MILNAKIKRLPPDQFRTHITKDDLVFDGEFEYYGIDIYVEGKVVDQAIIFPDHPIYVPHLPYYKTFKIYSNEDDELLYRIKAYLFLNPTIGISGLKKMANFISEQHLQYDSAGNPSFSYEEVYDLCVSTTDEYRSTGRSFYTSSLFNDIESILLDIDIVAVPKLILFSKNSKVPSDIKRKYTLEARSNKIRSLWEEVIYYSAVHAIDTSEQFVIVGKPDILNSSKQLRKNGEIDNEITSMHILYRYMSDRVKRLLERDGKYKYFTKSMKVKFLQFLELPLDDLTNREISKKLKTSLSYVTQFRTIKSIYKL